jgi:YesN/AraC family two-component response regulator
MPIKDISIETGYTDIQTFYKVFKKATGKTPQNYRNGQ